MGSGTGQVEFALGCLGKGGDLLEKVAFGQRLDGVRECAKEIPGEILFWLEKIAMAKTKTGAAVKRPFWLEGSEQGTKGN